MNEFDKKNENKTGILFKERRAGTTKNLKLIHVRLFEGIFPEAGEIRKTPVKDNGFITTPPSFLPDALRYIDSMPEGTIEEIIDKFIEMNMAHPFDKGNDQAIMAWLDLILRKNLELMVDWSLINKDDYLEAIKKSSINPDHISVLLRSALKEAVDDETFMSAIANSYPLLDEKNKQ